MAIELQDMRWAIIVSQHQSLRQAAETLNIRQSTLSRRIRSIEQKLGAALFERSNGGTRTTMAGQEFVKAARRVVEDADLMIVRLSTRARGENGRLTIGVHASFSAGHLRATLLDYGRKYPDVDIHLVDGSSDHLMSDLRVSAVDIAFVAEEPVRWDDRFLVVWSERVVVALPDDHLLATRKSIRWEDLAAERLLVPQRGPGREFLDLLARAMGTPDLCKLLRQDVGLDRLLTLVVARKGLLLALEGATGITYPGVVFREVRAPEGPSRLDFRAYWREVNGNPSLRPFLELLRERYPDLSDGALAG